MSRCVKRSACLVLAGFVCLAATSIAVAQAEKLNVLFIGVDDLANSLGCYGDPVAQTPHLDRLADRGVRFEHAYCQVPLCNPSRASILTGRRPDALEVYDLDRHFRDAQPDLITLPQAFQQNGWLTARVGKLYHYNVPAGIGTNGLDDPSSWQLRFNPKGRDTLEEHLITNAEPSRPISAALSWLSAAGTDEEQTDGMVATQAIEFLAQHRQKPFFLGVGFFRPHTPFVAPKKYFDLYRQSDLRLPTAPEGDREDIPLAAFAHNCPIPNYGLNSETCLQALHAYYACVSFVDAQVGRLMDALEDLNLADRTIVVLWSDHGYHLGEHEGIWQKRCLFEESSRSPLIVYVPKNSGNGTPCARVVELIDLYPTLTSLCGIPVDATLPGNDLTPLLRSPSSEWTSCAITQVLRPWDARATPSEVKASNPVMGRSIRTERWRYTQWNEGEAGSELYDHLNDPNEFNNLTVGPSRHQYQDIISELSTELNARAIGRPPKSPFNPARL